MRGSKSHLTTSQYWDSEWASQTRSVRYDHRLCHCFALNQVFTEFVPHSDLKILEVGVGGSIWPAYLREHFGSEPYGIDYSLRGCVSANLNYSSVVHESLPVVYADIFHHPFREQSFDVVYSLGVIEHFADPVEVLGIMKDLLHPGGVLLTTIPNKAGIAGKVEKRLNPDNYQRHNPMTALDLHNLYRTIDLDGVVVRYFGAMTFIGRVPDGVGLLTKTIRLFKNLINSAVFYPLYMKTAFRPRHQMISASVMAYGRKRD